MKYHIEPDIVTNWDVMKKKIMAKRERMMQIMFGRDNVLDMYMVIQAVWSPFALIRMTDLVMDLADDVLLTIYIYISYALPHTILRLDLAGRDPQEYLMKIPSDMECSECEMVYDIKEKMYHIVLDYDTKLKFAAENSDMEKTHELTDGNIITDDTERSRRQTVLLHANLSVERNISSCRPFRKQSVQAGLHGGPWKALSLLHVFFFFFMFRENRDEPVAGSM